MRIFRNLSRAVMAATLAGLAFPAAALAHGPTARPVRSRSWRPVAQPMVSMSLVSHGMALPTMAHHGQSFVAGERGERYAIRLTNNTSQRVEVVVSVDGRDVVSGESADFRRGRGYVLEPFGSVTIDGFRRSLEHVAAFRFSGVADSYTARLGTPGNAGIIAAAVFTERNARLARGPFTSTRGGAAEHAAKPNAAAPTRRAKKAPSSGAASRWNQRERQDLGTEFGETRLSRVHEVSFVRRNPSRPDFQTTLRYDSAQALAARGIGVEPSPVIVDPRPWPGTRGRFATPPPRR